MLLADAVVESHEGLVGRAYPKAVRACGAQLGADTAAVPDDNSAAACRRLDVLEGLFHRSASVWPRSRAPRMDSRSRLGPGVAVAGGENRGEAGPAHRRGEPGKGTPRRPRSQRPPARDPWSWSPARVPAKPRP